MVEHPYLQTLNRGEMHPGLRWFPPECDRLRQGYPATWPCRLSQRHIRTEHSFCCDVDLHVQLGPEIHQKAAKVHQTAPRSRSTNKFRSLRLVESPLETDLNTRTLWAP